MQGGVDRQVEVAHGALRPALVEPDGRPVGQALPHDGTQDRRVQAGHEADTGPRLAGVLVRRPHGAPFLTRAYDAG
jgi:hypothetical protein